MFPNIAHLPDQSWMSKISHAKQVLIMCQQFANHWCIINSPFSEDHLHKIIHAAPSANCFIYVKLGDLRLLPDISSYYHICFLQRCTKWDIKLVTSWPRSSLKRAIPCTTGCLWWVFRTTHSPSYWEMLQWFWKNNFKLKFKFHDTIWRQ